jgi:peptidyl-dipeptidase Dcp
MAAANPLLEDWTGPFGLAPFDRIEVAHYMPAFDAGMAEQNAKIHAITTNPEPPNLRNTIDALELSSPLLDKVGGVFFNLSGVDATDEMQAVERDIGPRLAQHGSEILMNAALFARIDVLFGKRAMLGLTDEQMRVLELTHERFVRAGAKLDEQGKARLKAIVTRLTELGIAFSQNVLADENSYQLALTEQDLVVLPDFVASAARQAAQDRKAQSPGIVTLSRSLIEPFLTFSPNRNLRHEAFAAWTKRGEQEGATDNRAIVRETLALRAERAKLLGFKTFAAYRLKPEMAGTPERVSDLLNRVWSPAKTRFASEKQDLQALAQAEGHNAPVTAADWRYFAEKLRNQKYDLDESELKPYFPLDQMIAASFYVAERIFGLRFKERHDVPVYHPDVRVWEVSDSGGHAVGLFLGDYFNRQGKYSGAWMSSYREQHRLAGEVKPIIVNVLNFAKPAPGEAALLSFDDAHTLFHELGHGLHGLLSNVTYPSIAGTSVARDFVELPSQLFEHWLETPEILGQFARHAKTGEPIPAEKIARIKAARSFNQGFMTVEYASSALVDLAFHTQVEAPADAIAFEAETLKGIGMPEGMAMRHRTPHFSHVFSGEGYASGYYSYLWSEVLDADAFEAFAATGNVFDPALAARLKQYVYSAGGSRDPAELYRAFRGQDPDPQALLRKRGLVAA